MKATFQNEAIYVVLGVDLEGQKEVLGLWLRRWRGEVWLQVLTELQKSRCEGYFFIACVDGLKGLPEATEAVYPRTKVQIRIAHLVRASLNYVPLETAQAGDQGSAVNLSRRPGERGLSERT